MTTGERRYSDDEVAEILARAADAELTRHATRDRPDGMTLMELQTVGAEAGLAPELIARAAATLDQPPVPERRTRLVGLPVGVSRKIPLPRALSQEEWERMVVSFRETFRARGRMRTEGGLREWSNGNLHALLEPTADGWALRLSTYKGDAPMFIGMGSVVMLIAALVAVLSLLGISGDGDLAAAIFLALVGAGQAGWGAIRLPGWAARREHQFEALGEEALRIASEPAREPAG